MYVQNAEVTAWVASILTCATSGLILPPYEPYYEVSDHASMALCEGRHAIPQAVDGAIFNTVINPLDVEGLQSEAYNKLKALDIKSLDLYVTGLTVALVSVLNACHQLGIVVTLYHYDREEDNYYSQQVL